MNAVTEKEGIELLAGVYELLPLAAIAPSETHIQKLRRARYNMELLADLRASISKLGVQQPVVVRKLTALRGLAAYELVAGERRYRAAGQAGLVHIPAVIRALTDAEVLEVQLVENLQREDLHPLEEAAGYEELMQVAKLKKEELGERVGKSRSWVYSRLNLLKLPKDAQAALQKGLIDVSRALLVASIAEPVRQAELLSKALARDTGNNPMHSVRELRTEILKERQVFPLVGAPFPIDDAGLVAAAGACGPCQFRTGNCDPEAADPDVCTNVPCFERKVKQHADRRRKEVLARGGKVLKGEAARAISPSVKTVYGHVDLDLVCEWDEFPEKSPKLPAGVYPGTPEADHLPEAVAWREREEAWQPRTYRALLAGEKYDAVLIDDPKTAQLRELVPFKQAQQLLKKKGIDLPSYANRKRQSFQRSSTASGGEKREDPAAAKARQEADARKAELEDAVRDEVCKRLLAAVKAKHDGALGVAELICLGAFGLDDLPEEADSIWPLFGLKDPGWQSAKALEKLSSKDLPKFIAACIVARGECDGFGGDKVASAAILKRLKLDPKAIEKDVRAALAPKAEKKAKK
jgi:ParB/RepB/Spo0J family partition protein